MPPSLLVLLFLTLHLSAARASDSATSPPSGPHTTAFLFILLSLAFFLTTFLAVCLCRRADRRTDGRAATTGGRRRGGLDPAILETFPKLEYGAVKGLRTVRGPLECSVCLMEFADHETLLLLPGCCHVFHPACIASWLADHVTCPVCRADLSDPAVLLAGDACLTAGGGPEDDQAEVKPKDRVAIDIESSREFVAGGRSRTVKVFRLSQSTADGADRFTLRLPEHVRREIEAAGRLRRAASLVGWPSEEFGASGRREARAAWSGPLESLWRTLSGRWHREGESGQRVYPVVAMEPVGEVIGGGTGKTGSAKDGGEDGIANG